MNRRTMVALTRRPIAADRSHLTLIVPEPLPEAVANAAKVDPTVLEPAPQVPVYATGDRPIPIVHRAEPPHRSTREPGKLEVWHNIDGANVTRVVHVDPVTSAYHVHMLPADGISDEVDDLLSQITHAVHAEQMRRRACAARQAERSARREIDGLARLV